MELLAVIGIIGLLGAIALPMYQSIANSHSMTRGAYEAAGLLEFAKSEAISRQTYVWAGFVNVTNQGQALVQMAAVYSRNGAGDNLAANNMAPLTRILRIANASLSEWNRLNPDTQALADNIVPESVAKNTASITFKVGNTEFDRTITFTPRGEALLQGSVGPDAGYNPFIDISFRETKGIATLVEADDVALLVEGATGSVQILRRQ